MARILVIDDDRSLREVVRFILAEAGHEVLDAADGRAGLELLCRDPDLVITDIRMPGLDGMEVLARIREAGGESSPPVIVLTAHGTVEQAVAAMRLGAFTYLLKPFAREELRLTVEQALHTRELEADNARLRRILRQRGEDGGLVHRSPAMAELLEQIRRAAPTDATVLISGESGTGKELAARACHDLSGRWDRPFVAVNCGAIPGDLLESTLFGHVKGAFTGADRPVTGKVRSAEGGTLFLDEIAELPLGLQPKLLRVLETREVDPVGGDRPVPVDFRLICATNRDLVAAAAAGRFREDLLYRINVLPLVLPPLRDRREDIAPLWEHFTRLHGGAHLATEPALLTELAALPWRGNVRELKNLNQRLVLMGRGDSLALADFRRLAPGVAATPVPVAADEPGAAGGLPLGPLPEDGCSLVELEKELIRRALARHGGNRSRTAVYLGIPRHVLVYRLDKYDLG
ncbi:MAG: sigma-54-dependent Fis family transcriptional regulator [Krumholzibacteria bacterium]|nr:sigma-54-dependent Fis family transcriptional regulator [Candidatus Krumholzibacteria bacterium]